LRHITRMPQPSGASDPVGARARVVRGPFGAALGVLVLAIGTVGLARVNASAPVAQPAALPAAVSTTITVPIGPILAGAAATKPASRFTKLGAVMFPVAATPRCYILRNFGAPRSGGRTHEGIDILASLGQPVYAVADGVLIRQSPITAPLSGLSWGFTADDGSYYFYAHLSAVATGLVVGSRVRRGDIIAYVGDTGDPGPGNYHLHFEVHPAGPNTIAVDPYPLVAVPRACTVY